MTATAKWFTVLFIGVMWSAVSVVAWPALLREQRLRRTAAITQGEIINYEPLNHGRVTYRYTVEGHVYTGFALASQHLVGVPVRVYYSPSDPSISMLTKPGESLLSNVVGLCILYAFFAVGAMVSAARSRWGQLT